MHSVPHSVSPTLQQATADPRLLQRLLDTHGQVWVSLLLGHCSFLLGPGAHKVLFLLSKSLFPQSCVSSGSSMLGLMATSSKRAYVMLWSAKSRVPAPVAGHCWPISLQETLKHSSASVSGLFLETLEKNHDAPRHTDYCSLVLQETILPIIRVSIAEKAVE